MAVVADKINELVMRSAREKDSSMIQEVYELYDSIKEKDSVKTKDEAEKEEVSAVAESIAEEKVENAVQMESSYIYYLIESIERIREDLPEIASVIEKKVPGKYFYLLECIDTVNEDNEAIQKLVIVKGKNDNMDYYPRLDECQSDREREEVVNDYLKKEYKGVKCYKMRFEDLFED